MWNQWSQLGQLIGFSDEHSTLVVYVPNLQTGYISWQYLLIFDDLFETIVRIGDNDPTINNICIDRFDYSRNWYAKEEFEPYGQ